MSASDEITRRIEQAIKDHVLDCGIPEAEVWAREWLNGTDRTTGTAELTMQYLGSLWHMDVQVSGKSTHAVFSVITAAAWAGKAIECLEQMETYLNRMIVLRDGKE